MAAETNPRAPRGREGGHWQTERAVLPDLEFSRSQSHNTGDCELLKAMGQDLGQVS